MEIWSIIAGFLENPGGLAPWLASLSSGLVAVSIAHPLLERRRRNLRFRQIAGAERRMRERSARARLERRTDEIVSLRHARPRRLYEQIVERLKLGDLINNPNTRRLIYRAGLRSPGSVIQVTAMRVLAAAALSAVTAIYLPLVLRLDLPGNSIAIAVALAALLGWQAPLLYLRNRLDKRKIEIRRNWPTALDLMLICVESGMSIEAALRKVAEEIASESSILSEELALTNAELNYLPERRDAFRRLAERTDVDEVGAVVTSLLQAEKHGTPIGQALRVLARESRALRMQAAEKKAAALPPKLTVPMILFFLPVLFAVIMTPAVIQLLKVD